jgi:hypothetical protein
LQKLNLLKTFCIIKKLFIKIQVYRYNTALLWIFILGA